MVALALASAVGLAAFGWPLLVAPDAGLAHAADAPLVLGAVVAGVLLVVHLGLADGGMDVKAVALLGLLAAVGAALRPLSAGSRGRRAGVHGAGARRPGARARASGSRSARRRWPPRPC